MSEKHIFGKLAESEKYLGINPLFEKAFAFLKRTDLAALPAGRQEIDGDRCWANVIDATLKPCAECKLEAHRRYIDIQMPVTGPEVIGVAEMDEAARALPFNEKDDYVLFAAKGEPLTLRVGEFAVFFPPYGGHRPGCTSAKVPPQGYRKICVKVKEGNN